MMRLPPWSRKAPMTVAGDGLPDRPAAVLLDAGGVVFLPRGEAVARALAAVDLLRPPAAVRRAHYRAMRSFDAAEGGTVADYAPTLADALEVPGTRHEEAAAALEAALTRPDAWGEVAPGAVEGIRALADSHLQVGIVSNSDGTVEAMLRDRRVCQVGEGPGASVDVILDSTVVGVAKPDRGIFELALEALALEADAAVHLGDSTRMDVAGARAAGIAPVHIDPFDDCPEGDHAHVGDVAELARRLLG